MNATTVIPTDLVTPLGAYLRLRETGPAAFLLESVEHGRLGRYSFVGCGSELVSFAEAEARAEPVVGYLGYDHAATLEPTVALPADGPALPESRFVVAATLVRFDHAHGLAEVLWGDPFETTALLEGPRPALPIARSGGRAHAPLPVAARLRAGSADGDRAHPRGRRLPDRPLAARRAADAGERDRRSTGRCAGSTLRRTTSCSSSATSRSSARLPRRSCGSTAAARASTRSPARCRARRATSSGCSPRRRTAPST